MPIKRVQFPDGSIKRIEVPEGATDEQIIAFAKSQYRPTATYVVTAPDGQEYEVDAPVDAGEDEVLAYAQQNYRHAGGQPRQSRFGGIPVDEPSPGTAGRSSQTSSRFGGIPVDEPIDPSQVNWDEPIDSSAVQWDDAVAPADFGSERPRASVQSASEAQLIAALRRADATGDVPAARAIARRIQSMRTSRTQEPGAFDDLIPQAPTLEQLERALIRADRAGDTQAARAIAADMRRLMATQQAGPFDDLIPEREVDFGNVRGGSSSRRQTEGNRGLQLAGRAVAQGVAGTLDMIGEGMRKLPTMGLFDLAMKNTPSLRSATQATLTGRGVTQPRTAGERVAVDVGEAATGTALTLGGGAAGNVRFLRANPVLQGAGTVTGATAAGVARENGASPLVQTVAGLAGGMTPAAASHGVPATMRGAIRGGERGRQRMAENIESFRMAGTTPTLGQATESRFFQGLESTLGRMPGSAGVIARKAEQQAQEIGQGVRTLADELSPGADAVSAGQAIERGIVGPGGFRDRNAAVSSRLYGRLDRYVPPGTRVGVSNTANIFDVLNPAVPGAPNITPLFQNARVGSIGDAFRRDSAPMGGSVMGYQPPQLPYQGVKQLRTLVGREVANANFGADVPVADWRRLYGGLSRDMEAAATASGPKARQAYERANTHYSLSQKRSDAIKHVVNRDTPEAIFAAAMQGTREGATTLSALLRSLPDAGRKEVAAAVLNRLGRATDGQQNADSSAFSTATFLTNWNRLSPQARTALFDRFGPEFRKRVQAIARTANNLKNGSKVYANPSGTAAAQAQNIGYGALGASSLATAAGQPWLLGGTVALMAANNGLARMVTGPGVVGRLAERTPVPYGAYMTLPHYLQPSQEQRDNPVRQQPKARKQGQR